MIRFSFLAFLAVACTPPADPARSPGRRFDGARALRDVKALVALGPRPAGSEAAEGARQFVAGRLEAAGTFVRTETAPGKSPRQGAMGDMGLVLAEIPGRTTSTLLVTANVDGREDGPDVARALGPAVLIELARALRAGDRPRHTFLFVATEAGCCALGVRALAADPPRNRGVALEVALEPRGMSGEAAMLWASPGSADAVDLWASAVDAPAGGAHLAHLLPEVPAARSWPTVSIGTRRDLVAAGSPADRPSRLAPGALSSFGQAALDLLRVADIDPDLAKPARAIAGPSPSYLELPLNVVVPFGSGTSVALGWLALALATWALVRMRRLLGPLVVALPWGATGAVLAVTAMAFVSEAIASPRGTEAPLRATAGAHVACMVLVAIWILLAWQRLGAIGPLRRTAGGLSQPAVLSLLAVCALACTVALALGYAPELVPLAALPLLVAVPSALAVARATDRRGRFVGAFPLVLALAIAGGPALADAGILMLGEEPRHVELALGIAALALPMTPALAATASASVLRPGAGQLALLAVVTGALAVWTGTAPAATRADPRRVIVTAVCDARPGRSVYLVSARDAVRVGGRRVPRPWYAAALDEGGQALALRAPDGLCAPPEVYARLEDHGPGHKLLVATVRPLRRAESIHLVLSPATRVVSASLPMVRVRPRSPWVAQIVAPPRTASTLLVELVASRDLRLGELLAMDAGRPVLGPMVPRLDRAWPTNVHIRSVGVTPLDTVYAPLPPPPAMPPDDPPPPPAGPEPWWSIMARERYRRH